MNKYFVAKPIILIVVLLFVLGAELYLRNVGADRLTVYYTGLTWVLMIGVGIIALRRNSYLLKRNAELELALADVLMKAEVEKAIKKIDDTAPEDVRH